jgi:hypothetical protein
MPYSRPLPGGGDSIRQHTSAYVNIRQQYLRMPYSRPLPGGGDIVGHIHHTLTHRFSYSWYRLNLLHGLRFSSVTYAEGSTTLWHTGLVCARACALVQCRTQDITILSAYQLWGAFRVPSTIRQHTSAHASIHQHTSAVLTSCGAHFESLAPSPCYSPIQWEREREGRKGGRPEGGREGGREVLACIEYLIYG